MNLNETEDDSGIVVKQYSIKMIYGLDEDMDVALSTEFLDLNKPEGEQLIGLFEGLKMLEVAKLSFLARHGVISNW